MEKYKPTIKDVAQISGVSIGTVDRVINNRGKVSPEKKLAVENAIKQLEYRPSQIARALSTGKHTVKIGITFPQVEIEFWAEVEKMIDTMQSKYNPFGVKFVTKRTYSYTIEEQVAAIEYLISQDIDCLLLTPVYEIYADQLDNHIPDHIPYATVINDTIGSKRLFHVGPDDFAMGELVAKLVSLYSKQTSNVVIMSPNDNNCIQQRISGFMSKIKRDLLDINIIRVCQIPGETENVWYKEAYASALSCINSHSGLTAFYVTNGLSEWVAKAVEDSETNNKIKVFGHEYTSGLPHYLENDIITATIYQRPALQWQIAINLLYEVLTGEREKENIPQVIPTECSIILKESLPLLQIGKVTYI